jgi:8-oxo-dGTP pyrophosphatase MutT (NUDIX family)
LLGRRADTAAFLPGTYVFPGGAVDPADYTAVPDVPLRGETARALGEAAFAVAAVRELFEETGLRLGSGLDLSALHYVFRAVTPPGYARRFDARFFVADAAHLSGDPDHLYPLEPELTDLQWVAVTDLERFRLPSITRFVLNDVVKRLPALEGPDPVPEVGV